jgi:hypothetical protein
MSEDDKLRFILIVSAIVAALGTHRLLEAADSVPHPSKARPAGVRIFNPSGFGFGRD